MCDRPNELAVCCALAQNRVHQNILSLTQSRCVLLSVLFALFSYSIFLLLWLLRTAHCIYSLLHFELVWRCGCRRKSKCYMARDH